MLAKIFFLAFAGALGTLTRFGLTGLARRVFDSSFPWGTLLVNIVGCFLGGLIWSVSDTRLSLNPELKSIVLIGYLGALTTFSTFIMETNEMLRNEQWFLFFQNLVLQNAVGIGVLIIGIAVGKNV